MTNRFRLRFMFWLDMQRPDEAQLAEIIDALKQERTFVSTIRDGIKLICDLRAGRTEVLFGLFPWVKEAIEPASAITAEQRIQEQIKRLEELLLAQGNIPIQPPIIAATIRPATEERLSRTTNSLNEVTSSTGKSSAEAVAKNFLNSMKGMASGFFD